VAGAIKQLTTCYRDIRDSPIGLWNGTVPRLAGGFALGDGKCKENAEATEESPAKRVKFENDQDESEEGEVEEEAIYNGGRTSTFDGVIMARSSGLPQDM
jgi:hypothetical protein